MPISPYSPCPGGCNKKIKFCCPDLLAELQKVERMLDGQQHVACLEHVQRLARDHPDRACLLATKTLMLRLTGRFEEAEATAAEFVEKHPENQVALAESAMLTAAAQGGREAIKPLLRAMANTDGDIHGRLWEALGVVARALAAEGQFMAARAAVSLQVATDRESPQPLELLMQLNTSPNVPLALKNETTLDTRVGEVPWKADFDEAVSLANRWRWAEAAEKLAALSEQVEDAPIIWRNLATLRGWMADSSGAVEALRKYSALEVPLEDAVEAEALALFLSRDPLGDEMDILIVEYSIDDADAVQAALDSAPQTGPFRVDQLPQEDEETPPPKAGFILFDRAAPQPSQELTLETVAQVLCRVVLYGKQTDRPARLELVGVTRDKLDPAKELLGELAPGQWNEPDRVEVVGQVSRSRELLDRNWRLSESTTREQLQELADAYVEDALLKRWTEMPLELLDGKSPQQAAPDKASGIRILAAVMLLEYWFQQTGSRFDLNRLRTHLGLPTLDPIELDDSSLESLPLVRLSRVVLDRLSDEAVLVGYQRAAAFAAQTALEKYARAVVERPSLSGSDERLRALAVLARSSEDPQEALGYIEQGREAAKSAGHSCAPWDMMELPIRFARGQSNEAMELIHHLDRTHIQEPGVAEAMTRLLVRLGILQPDGTVAAGAEQAAPQQPSIVIPGEESPEQGKLWTPDSQKPADQKPGIWTPDEE